MPPDWVQACAEGAAAQRWLLYQIAFGSEKCTEKKKKTSRSRECTAGNALHIVYSLHSLLRLITLPVPLARAQRQVHKHGDFEGSCVCQYISTDAGRRAQTFSEDACWAWLQALVVGKSPCIAPCKFLVRLLQKCMLATWLFVKTLPLPKRLHIYDKRSGNKNGSQQQAN